MFPKAGNVVHRAPDLDCYTYASIVADALRDELGSSHRAIKTIMRWSGASDRCVKNWIGGCCGPSGRHLLMLARHSDAVFECILQVTGRQSVLLTSQLGPLREALSGALCAITDAERASVPPH